MTAVSLVIFGGRGAGLLAADTARRQAEAGVPVEVAGFLNDLEPTGSAIGDLPVLGPFEHWRALPPETRFVAPIHKVGQMERRIARIRALSVPARRWFFVADPLAVVGQGCRVGANLYLGPHSVVKSMTTIGDHVSVRDGASIGHDVDVGDFAFIGTNATVGGYCRLGHGAYVGLAAVIREHVTVGAMATVGMGAVVVDDVMPGETVVGNPARPLPPGGRPGDEPA